MDMMAAFDHDLGPHDVICGRDSFAVKHPGNIEYRELILARRSEYQNARLRCEKQRITTEIINQVHANGGRFMVVSDGDFWTEQDIEKIYDKVSHSLRSGSGVETKKKRTQEPMTTEVEDALFKSLYETQELIYQQLLAKELGVEPVPDRLRADLRPWTRARK